ncbi:dolichyl-phosphate-mannose--protein mannosyltransferase [Kutzneria kofuensis]|uniref:Polyprenol-phosphate-mannose--protein mannosyltransferase n=1 Tax=Kutzneria kofuensis TaxID=103725 RepID=A0A7W9KMS3_9PSEU|nr:phospholipid carrier-dependent glycosyltransferase [Kutzneria kofuensis]MBB5895439.1 dolichyl-phosphate-mannose--protein O-mannosyl transferase [Kutzneria kofuensis]
MGTIDGVVDVGELPPATQPSTAGPLDRLAVWRPTDTLRGWLVTITVTLVGGLVRFWHLGSPTDRGYPVFDEKYYAPEAWQMLRNGGYEDDVGEKYAFIVHPPVGKYLISIGEWLFGYDGWGWRFSSAVAGAVCVFLIVRIGRRLTRSTMLGALAGVFLICDGVSHVQSRTALLDIFVALFVVIAFGCLLVDRDQVRNRLAVAVGEGWAEESPWGPRLGFRWWRFAAGISLGLACGVKWNGIYYIVAFGLLSVIWDATARRAAGVDRPWVGALVRDVLPALWSLVVIPVAVYFAMWWGWFGSETGVDRHTYASVFQSFLGYEADVLHFHETLLSSNHHHYWESKPWTWPMGLRPMLYYIEQSPSPYAAGCGASQCVSAEMLVGTPAMWWLAFPMIGWSLWRALVRFDWRHAAVMVGYMAGLLPWFISIDRQMFFFYVTPMAPFLVLGLVLACGDILGRAKAGAERRGTGLLLVAIYTGLVVADFVWLWPILNGVPISNAQWQAELWLPSWR